MRYVSICMTDLIEFYIILELVVVIQIINRENKYSLPELYFISQNANSDMKDVLSFQKLEKRTWYCFWLTYSCLIIGPIIYCFIVEFVYSENGDVVDSRLIQAYFVIRFLIYTIVALIYILVFTFFFYYAYRYHYAEFKNNILYLSFYFTAIFVF
jgi:hypothetical protein